MAATHAAALSLARLRQAARPALSAAAGCQANYRGGLTKGGVARGSLQLLARPKPALKPALSAAAGREASYRGGLTRGGVARGSNSYSRNDARFVTHSFECNRHFPCNCSGKGRGRPSNHCCREATITTVESVTTKVLYELKRSAGSGRAGSKNTEHVGAGCWWNGEVLQ